MRGAIGPIDVANTIRMMRTRYPGAVAIVEGEKDVRVYGRVVEPDHCRVLPGFGKAETLEAVARLLDDGVVGVVGIVDSDFGRVLGNSGATDSVLVTDAHDLEMMMIGSGALEKVLDELGSSAKIAKKGDVRRVLLNGAEVLGCLRLVSLQDGLDLTFEGLSFSEFVDRNTMEVDPERLIKAVKNKSQKAKLDVKALKTRVVEVIGQHDPFDVCCGHDVIGILSIGLRKAVGSRNAGEVSPDILERSLRLAYEKAQFSLTSLHAAMLEWNGRNEGFRVV